VTTHLGIVTTSRTTTLTIEDWTPSRLVPRCENNGRGGKYTSIVDDYRAPVITEFCHSRGRDERYFTRKREGVKTPLARDPFVVCACVPKQGMSTAKWGLARDAQNVKL
jgi:hypothetical protein